MPKNHLLTNEISPSSPHSESFKGFLLASYKSIANVARAHKITRVMLISYLLILVIAPPIFIMVTFLTFPLQTADFFNFQVKSKGQILGVSTSKDDHENILGEYVSALLEPQATAAVRALRVVNPEAFSDVVLPSEKSVLPAQSAASTTAIPGPPGQAGSLGPAGTDGAKGEIGLQGPAGKDGAKGDTGATGSIGTLTAGSGLTGSLTSGNLTLNLDASVPTSAANDTNITGAIASNVLTLGWSGQLSASRGGTGVSSTPSNGQLLIGNGTGYTITGLTAGSNIAISNGSGSISIGTSSTPTFTAINGLTITANGTNTLNIAHGKTLGVNNSITFSGTDSTSFTFPTSSDTIVGLTAIQTLTNKTIAAGSNTISGLTNTNLSGSAAITNANLANSSLTVTAGSGLTGGGSISLGSSASLTVALTSSETSGSSSSNSGLEVSGSGLSLIHGCTDGQLLKWTDAGGWACASDLTGSGSGSDLQTAAAYGTNDTLTNIASAQVTIASVSITPSTSTGDIYIRGRVEVFSSNNTDQSLILSIEDNAACTGSTLEANTLTITASNGTLIGNFELADVVVDAGASAHSYSLCASTATGDTDVRLHEMFATVIDTGADLAEIYTTNDYTIEPGDVVSVDSALSTGMKKSQQEYDSTLLGVVTTSPGLVIGGVSKEGVKALPIALSGRVPVKVSAVNGEIKPGDYLTSSKMPGVAMKATKPGPVIAMAMSSFDGESKGLVLAFVKNGLSQNDEIDLSALDKTAEASVSGSPANINSANQQETFISKLLSKLISWFADTANGISDFFANRVRTKQLCIGEKGDETCIEKSKLDQLLLNPSPSPSPAVTPASTINTEQVSTASASPL